MTWYLRRVHRNLWLKDDLRDWASGDDIPADNLKDFPTTQNELSFWLISGDKSDLNDVIAAIATTRDKIDHFDYLLFDSTILDNSEIHLDQSRGETSNDSVNSNCHFDAKGLSGHTLVVLLSAIVSSEFESDRYLKHEIDNFIRTGLNEGAITLDHEFLNQKLKDYLLNT